MCPLRATLRTRTTCSPTKSPNKQSMPLKMLPVSQKASLADPMCPLRATFQTQTACGPTNSPKKQRMHHTTIPGRTFALPAQHLSPLSAVPAPSEPWMHTPQPRCSSAPQARKRGAPPGPRSAGSRWFATDLLPIPGLPSVLESTYACGVRLVSDDVGGALLNCLQNKDVWAK